MSPQLWLVSPSWFIGCGVLTSHIDSGGPGTFSQLLIIQEIMNRLADDLEVDRENVYPADYFDLMAGVGFGGYDISICPYILKLTLLLDLPHFSWAI